MSVRNDISTYGRRWYGSISEDDAVSAKRLVEALEKLAKEVEYLQGRVSSLEGRVR